MNSKAHRSVRSTQRGEMTPTTAPYTPRWRQRYAARLWVSDLLVLVSVVYGAQTLWFGLGNAAVAMRNDARITDVSYGAFSAILVFGWMWLLGLIDSRDFRVIGSGITEYARVTDASFRVFGFVAIIAFLLKMDVARGYLLISLPAGIVTLLIERWLWRQWLMRKRKRGDYSARVLLVGPKASTSQISKAMIRDRSTGLHIVGACIPGGKTTASHLPGSSIEVVGGIDDVQAALAATGADTVVITSAEELPPDKVKQISWGLEAGRQHLVLAPSIVDIAGPRIHTRPIAGLPLIHVETPKFTRGQRVVKRAMDLSLSIIGGIIISPLLLILALMVKLSSPGPILFRQARVGRQGREFPMLKFRSMVNNAEDLLPSLMDQRDAGNDIMFKMIHDPRVTRVGRFMRRYSLDELPQIFNVIQGNMSLVGPRPPLRHEVDQYADHVHRRFLMKPGITGAWQVGGRSSLSWEDTVRLDLSYIENWTMLSDVIILFKTVKVALAPGDTAA